MFIFSGIAWKIHQDIMIISCDCSWRFLLSSSSPPETVAGGTKDLPPPPPSLALCAWDGPRDVLSLTGSLSLLVSHWVPRDPVEGVGEASRDGSKLVQQYLLQHVVERLLCQTGNTIYIQLEQTLTLVLLILNSTTHASYASSSHQTSYHKDLISKDFIPFLLLHSLHHDIKVNPCHL